VKVSNENTEIYANVRFPGCHLCLCYCKWNWYL